jgi:hypothetical protein
MLKNEMTPLSLNAISPHTKNQLKWIRDLIVKPELVKLVDE